MAPRGREKGGAQASAVAPWLGELLETVGDFGTASLELIAWELSLSEGELLSAKRQALAEGLIEAAGRDPGSDEETYKLVGWRRFPF